MLEVLNGASADLEALSNGVVDSSVCDNYVTPLTERRDYAGDGRECLGVDDATFGPQVRGDICFRLHVHVLGTVKLGRATWSHAVGA